MNIETVNGLLNERPFTPLEIRTVGGETHVIRDPATAKAMGGRILIHYPATDRLVILSPASIASIRPYQPLY